MKKLGASAAEDLLEIFVRRHEAGSTLITTNRPTQDWGAFLGGVPAPTVLSSGDDFKNRQKTARLRTARTCAILTAPAAGWFSNVR